MRLFITGGSGFIGTNVIEFYQSVCNIEIFNYDIVAPLNSEHAEYYHQGDIMNYNALYGAIDIFKPTHLLHLAARTECVENVDLETEFAVNIKGTQNVLDATMLCDSLQRVIITSSQYVCGANNFPEDMDDYAPATLYGQSKVITEQKTKATNIPSTWTIIRPTNVWGPWHMRYKREAWKVMKKGFYIHSGGKAVIRCYVYVGNVIEYINKIFTAAPSDIHKKTFYLTDPPADIYEWANGFNKAFTGKNARRIPRPILKTIAFFGELITKLGGRFPLTLSRYHSMTTDYLCPTKQTYDTLGEPVVSLKAGVQETVKWINAFDKAE